MGPHVSEGGRCAERAVERKAPKRRAFSPDEPNKFTASGMRSNWLVALAYASCLQFIIYFQGYQQFIRISTPVNGDFA